MLSEGRVFVTSYGGSAYSVVFSSVRDVLPYRIPNLDPGISKTLLQLLVCAAEFNL